MTPMQFKHPRIALGLSQNATAKALGLSSSRAIRLIEGGKRSVSGPVTKLMTIFLEDAGL